MGTGLGVTMSGTYIVVTAGTGILIFLDLVAYLIRKHLGLISQSEDPYRNVSLAINVKKSLSEMQLVN
jgi:hypothetical protein